MKPKNIELNIDELVLYGFAPDDRHRIGGAVEQELSRMFDDEGVPEALEGGREVASVDGGAIELATGSRAEAVGVQVAQAVYRGLRQ